MPKKKAKKSKRISTKDVPPPPMLGSGGAGRAAKQLRGRAGRVKRAMKKSGA